jgi:hypothetical protein
VADDHLSGSEAERLQRVLAAWSAAPSVNDPNPGAAEATLARAVERIGRQLPASAATLYRALDGGSMLEGNLNLFPLLSDSEKLAVTTASRLLRSWDWPIPDELVLFGDEGADDQLGLWLPVAGEGRPIVVAVAAIFEERSFAIVGDDLAGFLLGQTAFYLLSFAEDEDEDLAEAIDALGLPEHLRQLDVSGSDDEYHALLQWANPGLPDPRPDAYRRGLTAAELAAHAKRSP